VLEAVEGAANYEDMRTRVLAAYGQMDSEALSELLLKVMTMSNMAGRLAATEDL
jgi:phage gp29-like protein